MNALPSLLAVVSLPAEAGLNHYLLVSALLFAIGFFGVLLRRNTLVIYMSLELMLNASTLAAVGIAVVILVILWLVFRSLVGTIGLVLCVLLAGALTQVINPYAVPWVEKAMNRIGPPPESAPASPLQEPTKPAAPTEVAKQSPLPSPAKAYKQAESTVIEVMNARPSPVVLTWCIVFVACFIGFNLVLGRVSRVWRK